MANKKSKKIIEKEENEVKQRGNPGYASKIIQIKPVVTEKAVMLIESQNVLTFKFQLNSSKEKIKKEIENLFEVKVDEVRTMNRDGKKYAYIKLNPKSPAIDVATKLGMI